MSNGNGLSAVVETAVNDKVQAGSLFTAHDITVDVRGRGHRAGHGDVRDVVHDYYNRGGMGIAYSRTSINVPNGTAFLYHKKSDDPATYQIRGVVANNAPVSNNNSGNGNSSDGGNSGDGQTINIPSGFAFSSVSDADDSEDADEDADEDEVVCLISKPVGIANGVTPQLKEVKKTPSFLDQIRDRMSRMKMIRVDSNLLQRQISSSNHRIPDARGTLSIPATQIRELKFRIGDTAYVFDRGNNCFYIAPFAVGPLSEQPIAQYKVDKNFQIRVTSSILNKIGVDPSKNQFLSKVGRPSWRTFDSDHSPYCIVVTPNK